MLTLVDTGPLVALLDSGDPWHEFVRIRWDPAPGRFVTTAAVITEAMHFLRPIPGGPGKLFHMFEEGMVDIAGEFRVGFVSRAVSKMEKYADTPMDFADATLVALAEELEIDRIVTLDERGFRTYRHGRDRAFSLVLQEG